ncbi:MAG: 2-C-methyl-D-erythritol 2,4-cyclodiphosphate synthase [Planctomycetes bacterium]|nr:2-C-methyl-D-erythritol 2,4-cyclodiphosphate synthase [Planctomycetota bacterium]MBU1518922.1 2-C-methyl-D-erythritol 2,4-cyclodiphosphate synthase [Planctomycetota bacterium]MBU2457531.1 2-C-methyl-D-erythritol 2,4-cyclodiphosphate synthase [Planctomycetota bacterium]MBU2596927.1 2-C-methyl-D-erythritol 2,4-cyclodiphosphate synthase [Planctomycetota bacterium]
MSTDTNYEYRTGLGTDIHRLVEGRPLKLGGMTVPFEKGLLAHSDGDVALHALMDAIIGAAGLGDIGMLFPDSDPQFKNIDSKVLVLKVKEYIAEKKWEVVNADIIITAEEPKLGPYKAQMKRAIASLLGIDFLNVNVKAKTNEGLGETGTGLAISAIANVLLRRRIKRSL